MNQEKVLEQQLGEHLALKWGNVVGSVEFPGAYQGRELMPGCGQESDLGEVLMQESAYSVFLGVQASFLRPLRILWTRGKSYFW